jgi:two-component system LytT family response regulator
MSRNKQILTAVIIEDIEDARLALNQDIKDYCPEVQVIGEAEGVVSGIKLLQNVKPDIIFLDIQMGDGTGFDLLEIIGEGDAKVIFTTASDAYGIKAIKYSALEYLLKPIDPDELKAAVQKAKDNSAATGQERGIEILTNQLKNQTTDRIALNTQDRITVVKVADIVRCASDVNYTYFHFADKTSVLVTKTLKEFDGLLSDKGFIRVHQSHLVNVEHIKELVKADGGTLRLSDGSSVPVSTRRKQDVINYLSGM